MDNSSRYKIIRKIGTGGSSSVYLCTDCNISKKWALKYVLAKGNNLSLIKSEINLLKSLDYYMFPHIVDAFLEKDKVAIVTDYIEGENLKTHIAREGAFSANIAIGYFKELLEALIYLHSRSPGILYLDMKPANIMIKPNGEIRLIDFGIASSMILKSKSYGSIGYSPPEQYVLGAELSEKTDVFSLAMTLYEMLTGVMPKKDLSIQISEIKGNGSIPGYLKSIILKCVDPNPCNRPSPAEVIQMIEKKEGRRKGVIPVFFTAVLVASLFFGSLVYGTKRYMDICKLKYKDEMLKKASAHINNGEYDLSGLSILCGYIDSGVLDKDTQEMITYEVARYYFDIQKDYTKARIYFRKLDLSRFPDAKRYIDLCNEMRSFTSEDEEIKNMLKGEISSK